MKKRIVPVVIALLLILVIGGVTAGSYLLDKYSYSNERVDWNEYYQVSGEQSAIILQDEMVEEKAVIRNDICYFDLETVHKYLNEIFYADMTEKLLLYTTATETVKVNFGEAIYSTPQESRDAGFIVCYEEAGTVYVAADFVKQFTNFSYDVYDRHIQLYTEWGNKRLAEVNKDTAVRLRGGIKSPVLEDLYKGDAVEILEQLEKWSRVKTADSVIGYIENKRLVNETEQQEIPVTDYVAPEYTSLSVDGKVCLGWHAIGAEEGNVTLHEYVAGTKGMNVIAPTWFSLCDEEGNFRSFASKSYVDSAHDMGLAVWGVLDDFNFPNETGIALDVLQVLSSTAKREKLAQGITETALDLGLDGINLDFERLTSETGIHFVQFLRELSILCRSNGLVLSVDNYVPFQFNDYYRLDIQGQVADYVIIMGYDEHWHGSGDPGSVASIDYVSGGITRTIEEVPAHKVVNALPFYTILWKIEGAQVTDEYLTLNNTADFLERMNVETKWEESTCQNYVEWVSGNVTYKIWLEDMDSIRVKLNVMSANEIGGVAVWRLGYGTKEVWELIQAYVNS